MRHVGGSANSSVRRSRSWRRRNRRTEFCSGDRYSASWNRNTPGQHRDSPGWNGNASGKHGDSSRQHLNTSGRDRDAPAGQRNSARDRYCTRNHSAESRDAWGDHCSESERNESGIDHARDNAWIDDTRHYTGFFNAERYGVQCSYNATSHWRDNSAAAMNAIGGTLMTSGPDGARFFDLRLSQA